MSNMTITTIDKGSVELQGGKFRDELLTFAGADTFVAGTLLARQSVAIAVTASAVTGTGNGTVTVASVVDGPVVPLVGAYVLTCVATATHGGTWKLVDPNGAQVATDLVMTAGAAAATIFEAAGLRFTITDGATDFAAGDTATLTVAADGKMVPFNPAGAGGAQRPIAVLVDETTRTGAGNEPVRPLFGGDVNKNRLIIDVDGDGDNITAAILDQLRAAGIQAINVQQLSTLDNGAS